MSTHTCQAVGCKDPVQTGRFMCRRHWFGLPVLLRRQINETWSKRRAASRAHGVRGAAPAILAHVEACDEARRWTAVQEARLADYRPDADRLKRLYDLAKEQPS